MFAISLKKFQFVSFLLVTALSLTGLNIALAEKAVKSEKDILPHVVIKNAVDLVATAEFADDKQVPVLLFFSMNHCPYCIEVEEDYLKPMLRNSEYDNKIIMRKIKIDGTDFIRDFAGKDREPDEFSEDYSVSMVPTLILVDPKGKQIAPPIVGITNKYYYSGELDIVIDASLKKIREYASFD